MQSFQGVRFKVNGSLASYLHRRVSFRSPPRGRRSGPTGLRVGEGQTACVTSSTRLVRERGSLGSEGGPCIVPSSYGSGYGVQGGASPRRYPPQTHGLLGRLTGRVAGCLAEKGIAGEKDPLQISPEGAKVHTHGPLAGHTFSPDGRHRERRQAYLIERLAVRRPMMA